ncbi:GroES-like zinc-binding alcohol dehydrogenase family protein [Forsythia ovata]|uniref:GroES-like zinc-binding alcohol dehydrogenase family protein n=1 Tax=Forsythia ovata TaxID=205694 RepID=A0ABD1X8V7_9LAMI
MTNLVLFDLESTPFSTWNPPMHPLYRNLYRRTYMVLQNSFLSFSSLHQLQRVLPQSIPFADTIKHRAATRPLCASATAALKMVKAIRVHQHGGPEVLKWEDVEIGEPEDGEIKVKNKAIGLNFIDVYFRKGVYKVSAVPYTPGAEAAGVVTAVGPGVSGRKVGDLVAYLGNPMGAYTEEQIVPAEKVVPLPTSIDPTIAASVMVKGMTAQYLLRRCFKPTVLHTYCDTESGSTSSGGE